MPQLNAPVLNQISFHLLYLRDQSFLLFSLCSQSQFCPSESLFFLLPSTRDRSYPFCRFLPSRSRRFSSPSTLSHRNMIPIRQKCISGNLEGDSYQHFIMKYFAITKQRYKLIHLPISFAMFDYLYHSKRNRAFSPSLSILALSNIDRVMTLYYYYYYYYHYFIASFMY